MKSLELRFLGGMNIHVNGVPLTALKSEKAKALLCYLSVTGIAQPRSRLAGLLWTDLSERRARANLRKTLSRLKPHLNDYLVIDRKQISFNRDAPHFLDVADFEAGKAGVSDIWRLQESINLYSGDFLGGFALPDTPYFDEWVQAERARLRGGALDTLQTLVDHFMGQGEYDSGISYARQILTIEPWHEGAHRRLMHMLVSSGLRSAALKQFEEYRQMLWDELGVEPSLSTVRMFERIQRGELDPKAGPDDFGGVNSIKSLSSYRSGKPLIRRLPRLTTSLVGRQSELQELVERLTNPDVHLVTIVGLGGIGKTHLALSVAHQLNETGKFPDGVIFAPLSSVTTLSNLLSAIAEQIGVSLAGSRQPEKMLFNYLQDKVYLLCLDNFEQLLQKADFLMRLLQAVPQCKVLITSRERLRLREEWVLDLGGLPYPGTFREAQSSDYEAIHLFSDRARQIRSSFSIEQELPGVVRICQLTQGMPLALEQAASLIRVSQAAEIADQIEEHLDTLSTTLRNIPERHHSMRAVFDESWRWLSGEEQNVFPCLSVFRGGFTLEAAKNVAGASISVLKSLADKSLIRIDTGQGETSRYHLHELLRQYAFDRLLEAGQVYAAHLEYYLSLAERAKQFRDTEQEGEWLERLEVDRGNLLAALKWAIENRKAEQALRLNAALVTFWIYNSPAGEASDWLEVSLSLAWDKKSQLMMNARAEALLVAGYAALQISEIKLAEEHFKEASELYSELGNLDYLAWCLRGSGFVHLIRGDLAKAETYVEESRRIVQKIESEHGLAWSLFELGNIALAYGEMDKAERFLDDALMLFQQRGRGFGTYRAFISLGHLKRQQGKLVEAKACYIEALDIQIENQFIQFVAQILEGLGHLAIAENNLESAAKLFGIAQARRDTIEVARWAHHEIEYQHGLKIARDQLPMKVWQMAWDAGYALSHQQGVNYIHSTL